MVVCEKLRDSPCFWRGCFMGSAFTQVKCRGQLSVSWLHNSVHACSGQEKLITVTHRSAPQPPQPPTTTTLASIPSRPISVVFAPVTMDLSGQPSSGAAQRRMQRRLRSWWPHEQQSIAAALATAHHHSCDRKGKTKVVECEGREEAGSETYYAPRGPKTLSRWRNTNRIPRHEAVHPRLKWTR